MPTFHEHLTPGNTHVQDCCRAERQLLDEKDEMEAEISALKSKVCV